MPAVNTYHTLNDYRLSVEPVYENSSTSKWSAGALVIAIFLGGGAYLYYSAHQPTQQRSADTAPASASESTNYQAPVATESAVPTGTLPSSTLEGASTPGVTDNAAPPPIAPPVANARVPTQAPVMDSRVDEKTNVSPSPPAQRAQQSTQPPIDSNNDAAPAAPDVTTPVPVAPQPAMADESTNESTDEETDIAQEPPVTHSAVPADIDESVGG